MSLALLPAISPGILPTSPEATFSMVNLERSVSLLRLSHEYSFLPAASVIMGGVEAADVEPKRSERHREFRHDCSPPILELSTSRMMELFNTLHFTASR